MGGMWYHLDRQKRNVQCPVCAWIFPCRRSDGQCSKCGHRFNTDYNVYKSEETRRKLRKEHYKKLEQLEQILQNCIYEIRTIKHELTPLDLPLNIQNEQLPN
ncbi:hypothetical protein NZNM25_18670 [Nitrosopumilus zosterae]|uniref:Uncharacterized protein n=1 Tax=Nitrosopumilus zosterae TaxID=718286 RepID=A0A2S2KTX3_9ARCH|nr:hypothetical protein [Nitrosopumilus zosterae]GBH35076.1 hypothetical protein NZNM25_18670 [Nitrosopumilus zosterae]